MCSRGVPKIVCALTSEEDGLPARLTHTWPPPAPLSHASGVCASCVVWIGRRLDPFRHPRIRTDPPLPPHPGDDASPRSSCPAHALCPHLRTTTLAPTSSPPPPLPTRPPPSPPWQHWWTACTPSRGCRGGPRSLRPRLVRELWGGGGGEAVGVFALPLDSPQKTHLLQVSASPSPRCPCCKRVPQRPRAPCWSKPGRRRRSPRVGTREGHPPLRPWRQKCRPWPERGGEWVCTRPGWWQHHWHR